MAARLPDVIHIGYMRAGSTYLRSYFSLHPAVQWTRRGWYFQLGRDDAERGRVYGEFFDGAGEAACRIDMYESLCLGQYFVDPPLEDYAKRSKPVWSPDWAMATEDLASGPLAVDPAELARRIRRCVPGAKVLVVLRGQVDWLRSMYFHYRPHLPPQRRRFLEFARTREGRCALDAAAYDRTLAAYRDEFGGANVHVMLFEDLVEAEEKTLEGLCGFLKLPFAPLDPERAERNRGRRPGQRRSLGQRLRSRLAPRSAGSQPEFGAGDEAWIRALYGASNARTTQLLGRALPAGRYPT